MKKIDYLIVGQGISGTSFAWRAYFAKQSFIIIDNEKSVTASKAALGIYNPITGRKFNISWNYNNLINELNEFYSDVENKLNVNILHKKNIFRPFKNSSDNNEWNVRLSSNRYLKFIKEINEVGVLTKGSGYVDVKKYLLKSKKYFKKNNRYFYDTFKSEDLGISNDFFSYKNKKFRNIIMCTGIDEKNIKSFNQIKLNSVSGNSILIKCENKTSQIINKGINILPTNKNEFHIGSTYYQNVIDEGPDELISKTKQKFEDNFTLIKSMFGIRSASNDRRPIIGRHKHNKRMYIINAMGSKGVSQAPYCSKKLFNFINNNENIDDEINIDRFRS